MAKEILLYTSFNSYSVAGFIESLEASKGDSICVRMNTPGGSVYDGYGAIAKFNEFAGDKSIKIDGRADSFGAYFLCFCPPESAECLDVSTFTFHRAAMPSWFEADANYFTDEVKAQLNKINSNLRAGLEGKVTAQKWKAVTGVSLDEMFSLDSRIDVTIDAAQAKKLGLVARVNKITPQKLSEIKAYSTELAASYEQFVEAETTTETIKSNKMTIQDVKANSEVYAALKAEILAEEKDRIESFNAWAEVDAPAVLAAIVSGEDYKPSFGAKMQVKAMSKSGIKNIEASNAADTNNEEQDADEDSAETRAFNASKDSILQMAKNLVK